jgi:hypothetical protein
LNLETPKTHSRSGQRLRALLRSRWLWCVVILLVVTVGGRVIHRAMQPKYEGKTVEEWFEGWRLNTGEDEKRLVEVYSSFGTNAVWYLWRENNRKDSMITAWVMAKKHRFFGSGYKFGTSHEEQRHLKAMYLLSLLEDRCEPLIPEITPLLSSPNLDMRCSMISLLGSIRRRPEVVVPAIQQSLHSTNWQAYQRNKHIDALGEFGPAAKSVLPELQKQFINLAVTNQIERRYLAKAIVQINGPGPELEVFTNALVPGDFTQSFTSISFLERIGTNAGPAAPILRELTGTFTNEVEVKYVMEVIRKIDPNENYHKP